jgi:hypothetical protein
MRQRNDRALSTDAGAADSLPGMLPGKATGRKRVGQFSQQSRAAMRRNLCVSLQPPDGPILVPEMPDACEHHCKSEPIRRFDDLLIAH